MADSDLAFMRLALAEAARGEGSVEPNPMVGAVVVRDGQVVGVGHHERFGGPHAEVHALRAAGDLARGATAYVTLEPCCHFGKTPPCADALIDAGVARVVAAMRDPFPRVDGGGFARLQAAGIAVEEGLERDRAIRLNAPYLKRLSTGRPYVIAKWAMTWDGKTSSATGDSKWISGPRSRAMVHERRGKVDAIVVGLSTVLHDDPELTARPPGPRTPLRVVVDRLAGTPPDSRLVRTAREVPVLIAASDQAEAARLTALEAAGCEVLVLPASDGRIRPGDLLDELGRRGMTNVLVESGGGLHGTFLDAGEIDEVEVYLAPKVEGGTHGFSPVRGRGTTRMAEASMVQDLEVMQIDGDVRLRGTLPQPWRAAFGVDRP